MKIKVKYLGPYNLDIIKKGDWVDLKSAVSYTGMDPVVTKNKNIVYDYEIIPLGIAIQLPKEFEAIVNPRSSSYNNYGFIIPNSQGVIDSTYCGDNDEWKCPCLFLKTGKIEIGDRICQFRIQPSQFASIWTKLKWLFTSKIELVEVSSLGNKDRGGIGSTGK